MGTVLNKGHGHKQEEEKKFEAFKGKGVKLSDEPNEDVHMKDELANFGDIDDPELAYALKLSMLEEQFKKLPIP